MLIHGDNLLALKALEQQFAGQVKCIYIDPPYNTGTAFTHYDDGLEHSIWLGLMRERLEILHELLANDGSLWISIDDREEAYLKVVCDELFGRDCFVSNIAWQRTYSTRNDAKGIVNEVEHILVYSKQPGWQPNKLPRTAEMDSIYKNPDNDVGAWTSDNPFAPGASTHQGMVYAIQHPFTGEWVYPVAGRCWTFGQEDMLAHMCGWAEYELREIDDAAKRATICGVDVGEVRKGVKAIVLSKSLDESRKSAEAVLKRGQWPKFYFTKNGKGGIRRKTYLSNVGGVPPTNLWEYKDVGHTDEAKKEILALFKGKAPFDTPKPERLIKRVLEVATKEGDLVLDSFLGSGTTAAVAHKMGRRWIGIELLDHCYTNCAPRMNMVVDGDDAGGITKTVNWKGGGGYRFFELAPTLITKDQWGQEVINKAYKPEMLAEAVCKLEGFTYAPSETEYFIHGHSTEKSFIYVTTNFIRKAELEDICEQVGEQRSLLICCKGFDKGASCANVRLKKIPEAVLKKCEWGHDDYSLNVANLPMSQDEEYVQDDLFGED
ncbi:MAG: site-specific DNA-methyltransferase [Kiritimatiellae bacterium]|nr:site-specific DNA-methyltransferase [Kiritimatiellia bacterium]